MCQIPPRNRLLLRWSWYGLLASKCSELDTAHLITTSETTMHITCQDNNADVDLEHRDQHPCPREQARSPRRDTHTPGISYGRPVHCAALREPSCSTLTSSIWWGPINRAATHSSIMWIAAVSVAPPAPPRPPVYGRQLAAGVGCWAAGLGSQPAHRSTDSSAYKLNDGRARPN